MYTGPNCRSGRPDQRSKKILQDMQKKFKRIFSNSASPWFLAGRETDQGGGHLADVGKDSFCRRKIPGPGQRAGDDEAAQPGPARREQAPFRILDHPAFLRRQAARLGQQRRRRSRALAAAAGAQAKSTRAANGGSANAPADLRFDQRVTGITTALPTRRRGDRGERSALPGNPSHRRGVVDAGLCVLRVSA